MLAQKIGNEPLPYKTDGKAILLIDNSQDMLVLHKTILELDGFRVFMAKSGTEALRLLSEIEPPDLILLDMRMDDMSGPEFLMQLEEDRPNLVESVPIVYLTGVNVLPKGRALGLISKTVDMDEFLASIHRFIEQGHRNPKQK